MSAGYISGIECTCLLSFVAVAVVLHVFRTENMASKKTAGQIAKKKKPSKESVIIKPASEPEQQVACSSELSETRALTKTQQDSSNAAAPVNGYVHKLLPLKRNRRNTMDYSTLVLQTESDTIEALLYAKTKRPLLVDSVNSHTPLKIQRFTKSSDGEKLIINDLTKVGIAKQGEYTFRYKELDFKTWPIEEILESADEWDNVSLRGKAIHVGDIVEVGAKKLKLLQATFSDNTGSIAVDVWEQYAPLIESGKVYLLRDLHLRIWAGVKKVSTTWTLLFLPLLMKIYTKFLSTKMKFRLITTRQ